MALAFATSIDTFILGIGFGLLRTNLITNMGYGLDTVWETNTKNK